VDCGTRADPWSVHMGQRSGLPRRYDCTDHSRSAWHRQRSGTPDCHGLAASGSRGRGRASDTVPVHRGSAPLVRCVGRWASGRLAPASDDRQSIGHRRGRLGAIG
jgi:hypothetical protein